MYDVFNMPIYIVYLLIVSLILQHAYALMLLDDKRIYMKCI